MNSFVLLLLGAPRLERGGAPVIVDTRKALALLAYLAVTGRSHRRDALAALLWPDYPDGRAVLRRTLSSLSRALDGAGLDVDRESIGLIGDALAVDVTTFRRLAAPDAAVEPDDAASIVERLEQAVALYRDDFLAGFHLRDAAAFDDWCFFEAEGLRRELADTLDRLVAAQSRQGAYVAAIAHARRRLALDPLHEPAHQQLMQLYAWAGQRAAALRQYQRCVRVLHEELGVAPQPALTALYQAIRVGAGPPPPTSAARPARALLVSAATPPPVTTDQGLPFVGRAAELTALLDRYRAVGSDGQIVFVEGEAGIGKTRLVDELVATVRQRGGVALIGRCFADQAGLAYAPIGEALREALSWPGATDRLRALPAHWLVEASRLLPELASLGVDLPPAPPLDSPGAQGRFLEGIAQVIQALVAGEHPGLVVLDDLHWADEATLDLLAYLVRRLPGRPLLLVVTWRTEETPTSHRLRRLLAEAARTGVGAHLALDRLSRQAAGQLLAAPGPTGDGLPDDIIERVYAETEGLPFFLVQYRAAIDRDPAAVTGPDWARPGSVQALLRARLAPLDAAAQQLLAAAAVIGRSFDIDTLLIAAGVSEEEAIATLEALLARRLVREAGGDRQPEYDFAHEQLRAVVYADTSLARRRLLHRRVADALAMPAPADDDGARAGRRAHHYEQAGQRDQAARAYRQAGEYARRLSANQVALAHFRAALTLGDPDPASLHEALGDLHTLLGDYDAAIDSYTSALTGAGREQRIILGRKLGGVHHRRGEYARAVTSFATASDGASAADQAGERARLLADWSLTAVQQGDTAQATALVEQALTLAEASGDAVALAQVHNACGILASGRGDLDAARQHLERSLALAETLADPGARVAALNNLALVAEANGQRDAALAHAGAALALCVAQGDRHRAAALHSRMADLLHAGGQMEPAMAHLKEAVRIYAEIGVEAGTVQPHIWRLSQW